LVTLVKLKDILKPPSEFVDKNSKEYKAFVESVKELGVLSPVILAPKGEKFQLVTGLVRYHASLDCGKKTIPAEIKSMSDVEIEEMQLLVCAHKITTTPVEYATALKRLLKSMSIEVLAEKINQTPDWIRGKLNESESSVSRQEGLHREPAKRN